MVRVKKDSVAHFALVPKNGKKYDMPLRVGARWGVITFYIFWDISFGKGFPKKISFEVEVAPHKKNGFYTVFTVYIVYTVYTVLHCSHCLY